MSLSKTKGAIPLNNVGRYTNCQGEALVATQYGMGGVRAARRTDYPMVNGESCGHMKRSFSTYQDRRISHR